MRFMEIKGAGSGLVICCAQPADHLFVQVTYGFQLPPMRAHSIEDISTLQSVSRGIILELEIELEIEIETEVESRPCAGLDDGELFAPPEAARFSIGYP